MIRLIIDMNLLKAMEMRGISKNVNIEKMLNRDKPIIIPVMMIFVGLSIRPFNPFIKVSNSAIKGFL
jgi:hypothetical protein